LIYLPISVGTSRQVLSNWVDYHIQLKTTI